MWIMQSLMLLTLAITYTIMSHSEIYIKNDLVYDKHKVTLVGFVDISDISNQILEFQDRITNGHGKHNWPLANTIMMFMMKGLFHKFDYPYVQFACEKLTGDLLVDPM